MSDEDTSIKRIILPVNRAASLRIAIFAIALAGLGFVAKGFIWVGTAVLTLGTGGSWLIYLLCVTAIISAGVNGYANDDLLVTVVADAKIAERD